MIQNCDNGCLDPTSDKCVISTIEIPFLGIKKGESYDKAFMALAESLADVLEANVELQCLYDDTCEGAVVNVPTAVKVIINKLCNFSAEDVDYTGPTYCIGEGSTSGEAFKMVGRSFKYSISTNPVGSSLEYDLNDALKDLPEDYAVGSTRVTVSGTPKRGKSVINTSKNRVASIPVENDRYPLNMAVDLNVLTPNGTVTLSKNLSIPSPLSKSYNALFDVRDFTSPDNSKINQSKFNDLLASELCSLNSYLTSLRSFEIADSGSFNPGGPGIESAVGALAGAIQGLYNKIESLEKQMETCCQCCNNCGCGDSE